MGMGASGAANTAATRLAWAFFCLVGHKMSTRSGKRCPPVLAAESQQPEDQLDAVDAPPPLLWVTRKLAPHTTTTTAPIVAEMSEST